MRTPQVFLTDEPLSNLDAKLRVLMRAELKHLRHETGVTLGVRPEGLSVVARGMGDVDGEVYAVEPTGESVLVTVAVGEKRVSARADRHWRSDVGGAVGLKARPGRLHVFDTRSGARLAAD